MRSCFIAKTSATRIAIADVCDYYGQGYIITRINVPEGERGKGIGNKLLKEILNAADEEGMNLFLEIKPSGEMNYGDLEAWYCRNGFKKWNGMYRRRPDVQRTRQNANS